MQTLTVSFFGHRIIENSLEIENRLEHLIRTVLREHEYVEFLVGRDGEFDQLVSSTIRRCKREYRSDNSTHIWVLPYLTKENHCGNCRLYCAGCRYRRCRVWSQIPTGSYNTQVRLHRIYIFTEIP